MFQKKRKFLLEHKDFMCRCVGCRSESVPLYVIFWLWHIDRPFSLFTQKQNKYKPNNRKEGRKEGKREKCRKEGLVYAYYEMNLQTNEIARKVHITEAEVLDIIKRKDMQI